MRFPRRSRRQKLRSGSRLPVERGERLLDRGSCGRGCDLYLSTHGIWEWPVDVAPVRHCWCSIESLRVDSADLSLQVHSGRPGGPGCVHQLSEFPVFVDAAMALDSASRQASFSFSLDSGSRAVIVARACAFDGALRWHARLEPDAGAVSEIDAATLARLTRHAAYRYGGSSRSVPDDVSVLDVCRRRLPIEYDGKVGG